MKSIVVTSLLASVLLCAGASSAETGPARPKRTARAQAEDAPREAAEAQTPRADGAADAPAEPSKPRLEIAPYAVLAGGVKVDALTTKTGDDRQDRAATFAVSKFGLTAGYGEHLSLQSEIMASGGIGLHGTSTYEGQAALQVRTQRIRVEYAGFSAEVGRIVDEASLDFISGHVHDTLLQDTATRDPLLYSGFNLGNGAHVGYQPTRWLRGGVHLNMGNPVSTTSTLAVGGTFPPFERLYTQAYQAVNQGPNHFPDDTFHAVVLTPSLLLDTGLVDARVAVQVYDIDTNMTKQDDAHVRGYNARGTARVKLLDSMLVPFASGAYTRNDTLVQNNLALRAPDRYQAIVLGGGLDFNYRRRFRCAHDCADGVGAQVQQVQFQIGDGVVTTLRYASVGSTFWLFPQVAVDARVSLWTQDQKGAETVGEKNLIVGLRAVVP